MFLAEVLAACLLWLTATAQEPQVLRSGVERVRVDVTVTDRDGRFVEGLTEADFEILDNGRPQNISEFHSGPSPVTSVFLADMSDSMLPHALRLGSAANAFIDALQPEDRTSIRSLSMVNPIRTDTELLREDLSQPTVAKVR